MTDPAALGTPQTFPVHGRYRCRVCGSESSSELTVQCGHPSSAIERIPPRSNELALGTLAPLIQRWHVRYAQTGKLVFLECADELEAALKAINE